MNFSIHQSSQIGNRKHNQDRVAFAYGKEAVLLILADGMGGHLHGELAATLAIETFIAAFSKLQRVDKPLDFLTTTMRIAHHRIMELPQTSEYAFPGTTCVAAIIQDGMLYWGHAGDSRLYLFRDNKVQAKTLDHSMVQMWLDCGAIDEEEARNHPRRNQITNCLGGVEDQFEPEIGRPVEIAAGDVVLLCSDGLSGPFLDQELAAAFNQGSVAESLDGLIVRAIALESGHADNTTGLALRWGAQEGTNDTEQVVSHILEVC